MIPQKFAEALSKIPYQVSFEVAIKVFTWALQNPERAEACAEKLKQLNVTGQRCFVNAVTYWGENPEKAVETAMKTMLRKRGQHSQLAKLSRLSRTKEGFTFQLPDKRKCTVHYVKEDERYLFQTTAGNEEITVVYSRRHIGYALSEWLAGKVWSYGVKAVIYKQRKYTDYTQIHLLLDAIEQNLTPEISVLLKGETK